MYIGLLHLHSALRYIILVLLIISIVKAFSGWLGNKGYTNVDNKLSLFTLISVHTQFLIGLVLYFISPIVKQALGNMGAAMKEPSLRFWSVEHLAGMIIAIVLITIGRSKSRKAVETIAKHKFVAIFFTIALVLILISIPWPFSRVPRPWF